MKKNEIIPITTFSEMEYYMNVDDCEAKCFVKRSELKRAIKENPYTVIVIITDDMYERLTAITSVSKDYENEATAIMRQLVIAEQRQQKVDALIK